MTPPKPYKIVAQEPGAGTIEVRATGEMVGWVHARDDSRAVWFGRWFGMVGLWPDPQTEVGYFRYRTDAADAVWQAHLERTKT